MSKPPEIKAGVAQRGEDKTARIPIKIVQDNKVLLRKPAWIRAKLPNAEALKVKAKLRHHKLHSVCEEAACPNLGECFSAGTATFMILGGLCTRRCPFCDVAHGRPLPPDDNEAENLALAIAEMGLKYVVITSVDRDDLRDGGAQHFVDCIRAVRSHNPTIRIETLVPDFRGRQDKALEILHQAPPDVFNHNLETVPRLYPSVRPGADYATSLKLLKDFKHRHPTLPSKSGLMLGLGENTQEVLEVMKDLRAHHCDMLTLGQYLQPTRHHLAVERYVSPSEFEEIVVQAYALGFSQVAGGPLVRSSYHAEQQAHGVEVGAQS